MSDLIYAIDFGTTNSLLSAASPNQIYPPVQLDPEARDPTILRSVLYFPSQEQVFYGARAIREFSERDLQGRLVRSIKKYLPSKTFVGTYVEDRPMNLEDLIGNFLREMKRRADDALNADVTRVVLGRPARFSMTPVEDEFAQYRLERSAKEAGFKEIHFLEEPVAAAMEFRSSVEKPETILVADLGGGTSDFTIIRFGKEAFKPSDVLAIGGVPVAGDMMDGAMMQFRISKHFGADLQYKAPFGSNVLTMPKHLMKKLCSPADLALLQKRETRAFFENLKKWSLAENDQKKIDRLFTLLNDQLGFPIFDTIEKTKISLSDQTESIFQFDYPEIEIKEAITREQFNDDVKERVSTILKALDETVRAAGISNDSIDQVCCTGGTAYLPIIKNELALRFGESKLSHHNHYHAVVEGLAERAQSLF